MARLLISVIALCLGCAAVINPACAQKEFPPPQGAGRVVVVISGASGIGHYEAVSAQIARSGYDVVLYDGNTFRGQGAAFRSAIQQAQRMPHALPGKVGLVAFSLGGGEALGFASKWNDLVSAIIAWYPATVGIRDVAAFVQGLRVPVLTLTGAMDMFQGCCLAGKAQELAAAATAANKPFELVTYPNAGHDFVYGGYHYDAQAYSDALQRTITKLNQYVGR